MRILRNGDGDDHLEKLFALPSLDPEKALAENPPPAPGPDLTKPTDRPAEDRPTDDNDVTGRAGPGGLPPLAHTEVVPPWMRRPVDTAQWAARYVSHITRFHLLRLPAYLGRSAGFAPRGLGRAVGGLYTWAADTEARPLRKDAIARNSVLEYSALNKMRAKNQKWRLPVAAGAALTAVALVWAWLPAQALPTRLALALGAIIALGWHGRPMGEPFIPSAVVTDPKAKKITLDMVARALIKAGLATEKDPPDFLGKPGRDGKAWTVIVDLPEGRTVEEAIKKRKSIASAMRVSSGRLFVTPVTSADSHEARFEMRIADTDPMTGPPVPSPLLKRDRLDVWKDGIPFGSDPRGLPVYLHPLWTHSLFCGITDTGKTFSLRLLVLGLALDPTVRFAVFDAAASPDWRDMELIAHRCGFDDSDETARLLQDYLRECERDMTARMKAISALPRAQAREGKLTKELAKRFPLTFILLEEFQDYLSNEKYGVEISRLVTKLLRRGRKAGFFLCLATQRPDGKTMPTAARSQVGFRFCLRVDNRDANEMALGTGMDKRGFDAVGLDPAYKGVGYAVGPTVAKKYPAGGTLVRCHYLNGEDAEVLLLRCREARQKLGLLSGMADGEVPDEGWSLLDDVTATFGAGDEWLWSTTIIERLGVAHPGRYGDMNAVTFGRMMTDLHGVETRQISRVGTDGRQTNNRGIRLEQLADAHDRRQQSEAEIPEIGDETEDAA